MGTNQFTSLLCSGPRKIDYDMAARNFFFLKSMVTDLVSAIWVLAARGVTGGPAWRAWGRGPDGAFWIGDLKNLLIHIHPTGDGFLLCRVSLFLFSTQSFHLLWAPCLRGMTHYVRKVKTLPDSIDLTVPSSASVPESIRLLCLWSGRSPSPHHPPQRPCHIQPTLAKAHSAPPWSTHQLPSPSPHIAPHSQSYTLSRHPTGEERCKQDAARACLLRKTL